MFWATFVKLSAAYSSRLIVAPKVALWLLTLAIAVSIYPKVVDCALPVITCAAKSIVSSPEVVPAAVTFKLVKMSKSAEVLPSTPACDASVAAKVSVQVCKGNTDGLACVGTYLKAYLAQRAI